jgi:hypothetical protein
MVSPSETTTCLLPSPRPPDAVTAPVLDPDVDLEPLLLEAPLLWEITGLLAMSVIHLHLILEGKVKYS